MLVLFKQYLLKNSSCNFVVESCSCKDDVNNLKLTKHGEQRTVLIVMHKRTMRMFLLNEESKCLCGFNSNTAFCLLVLLSVYKYED